MTFRVSIDIDVEADSSESACDKIEKLLRNPAVLDFDMTDVDQLDEDDEG